MTIDCKSRLKSLPERAQDDGGVCATGERESDRYGARSALGGIVDIGFHYEPGGACEEWPKRVTEAERGDPWDN